jgi:BolA protein
MSMRPLGAGLIHNLGARTIMSSTNGPIARRIREKVTNALEPRELQIWNDSHKHSHHQAMRGADNVTESHFRLLIVSDKFSGKTQPARHRMVYGLLDEELKQQNGVHALQLQTKTLQEWEKLQSQQEKP